MYIVRKMKIDKKLYLFNVFVEGKKNLRSKKEHKIGLKKSPNFKTLKLLKWFLQLFEEI